MNNKLIVSLLLLLFFVVLGAGCGVGSGLLFDATGHANVAYALGWTAGVCVIGVITCTIRSPRGAVGVGAMDDYCCEFMRHQLTTTCSMHGRHCPDLVIAVGESGHKYLVSPNATYELSFCPACGAKVEQPPEPNDVSPASS